MKAKIKHIYRFFGEDIWALLICSVLSVLILGKLLFYPGFVLTLDMIFAPNHNIQWEDLQNGYRLYNDLPVGFIKMWGSALLGGEFLQKIILFVLHLGMGISMYFSLPTKEKGIRILGAVFFMLNPFVHTRMLAGHWQFLCGYALLPVFIHSTYTLFSTKKKFSACILPSCLWALMVMLSPHFMVINSIVFLSIVSVFLYGIWRRETRIKIGAFMLKSALYVFSVIFLCSYWLIPYFFQNSHELHSVGMDHFYAFATMPDTAHGMFINVLSMYGFWQEGNMFELTKYILPHTWLFIFCILFTLCCVGCMRMWRVQRDYALVCCLLFFCSLGLSMGVYIENYVITEFLSKYFAGFNGMREMQKFSLFLPYVYSIALVYGVEEILYKWKGKNNSLKYILAFCVTLCIALNSAGQFNGGGLKNIQYPSEWYEFHSFLEAQDSENHLLSLPWHQYTTYEFIGRNTLDPTPYFFGRRVISSKNMDVIGVSEQHLKEIEIEFMNIQNNPNEMLWKEFLAKHSVEYILLHKNFDKHTYSFLEHFSFLNKHSDAHFLTVYSVL